MASLQNYCASEKRENQSKFVMGLAAHFFRPPYTRSQKHCAVHINKLTSKSCSHFWFT